MKSPKNYCRNTVYSISSSSTSLSSTASIRIKSAWNILTKSAKRTNSTSSSSTSSSSAFTLSSSTFTADRRISNGSSNSSNNSTIGTLPSSSVSMVSATPSSSQINHHARKKKWIEKNNAVAEVTVPPFSPTYCKPNEFPYSNFYIKLPNGKWMIRYRSGNRDILGTDEFEGYM
ncbi:hypothetical protein BCR42DRAFT_412436, partial [Absidia repens]